MEDKILFTNPHDDDACIIMDAIDEKLEVIDSTDFVRGIP